MLVAKTRFYRAASMSSTRICCSTTPALFTKAVTDPNESSTVWNNRMTSASELTSAATAIALSARLLDVVGDRSCGLAVTQVTDANRITPLGREPRGSRADAAAAAGNDNDFVHAV